MIHKKLLFTTIGLGALFTLSSCSKDPTKEINSGLQYHVYQGNKLFTSFSNHVPFNAQNEFVHNNSSPSFSVPSFDGFDQYVSKNKALPQEWGDQGNTWQAPKTYQELGGQSIGTELICTKLSGCNGQLEFQRNSYNPILIITDLDSKVESTIDTSSDPDKPAIKEIYLNDNGKFRKPILKEDEYGEHDIITFKVNYNEPIAYLFFNSTPGETIKTLDSTGINYKNSQIISSDGKQETMSAGTFWELTWQNYTGAGVGVNRTISVSHGLTKTTANNMGVEFGMTEEFDFAPFDTGFKTSLSQKFSSNWSYSTAINESTTDTTQVVFAPENYNRIIANYKLMIGLKSKAPMLENYMKSVFNPLIKDNFLTLRLSKSNINSNSNNYIDNSLDAHNPNSDYIYANVGAKY